MDGKAVVYCENSFDSTYGKTAHGLVRFTGRYKVVYVIDSSLAGRDAGEYLDGRPSGIMIVSGLKEALHKAEKAKIFLTHFVIGVATDGGKLEPQAVEAAREAAEAGLNIDSGLHEYISDIPEIAGIADRTGSTIRDIRRTAINGNRAFSGKINEVTAKRIAVLGTDSAIGKRTTSWKLVHALQAAGRKTELIGTGQTAWMQGAEYGIILDSMINDFISGELEHAIWSAWKNENIEFAVIEGQGSLMNPAYPGGFEILAAGRPHAVIMQHAPARTEYDGFPGFPLDSLDVQIQAVELISKRRVVAVTINHEGLKRDEIDEVCRRLESETGLPVIDPLIHDPVRLVEACMNI